MNADERDDILRALGRIPATAWSDLLDADAAPWLRQHRDSMHDALKEMGIRGSDSARSIAEDVVDVLGHQLLSHHHVGPWVREQLLRALAPTKVRGDESPWLKRLQRLDTLGVYATPEASSAVT